MNFVLQVLAVCLFLKACAANFNQAVQDPKCKRSLWTLLAGGACDLPLLEALSILVGYYSNAHQISRQEHYDKLYVDPVDVDFKPLDIPALNKYYPVLFAEKIYGVYFRYLIKLSTVDELGQYILESQSFLNADKYQSGELDFADLTRDDLSYLPTCTDLLARHKDIVVTLQECVLDYEMRMPSVAYNLNFLCHSLDVVVGEEAPETYAGIPYMFNKTKSYSLPESWLVGYDNYENPCSDSE